MRKTKHSVKATHDIADMTDERIEQVSMRFKVLAEPMRLKILRTICEEEKSVQEIVKLTKANQANISKHLSMMAESGIVSRRKDGLNCYYTLADESIFQVCQIVTKSVEAKLLGRLKQFQST
jgi:DNA-binding transcriptional ArsR family regulator